MCCTAVHFQVCDLKLDLQEAHAEWEVKLQALRQEKAAAEVQLRRALVSMCITYHRGWCVLLCGVCGVVFMQAMVRIW